MAAADGDSRPGHLAGHVTRQVSGHVLAGILTTETGKSSTEQFDTLLQTPGLQLERIVSPPGFAATQDEWLDQSRDEFVLVLQGRGALVFAEAQGETVLNPGDYLRIPAGVRHRVSWTDPHQSTIWLALHFDTPAT